MLLPCCLFVCRCAWGYTANDTAGGTIAALVIQEARATCANGTGKGVFQFVGSSTTFNQGVYAAACYGVKPQRAQAPTVPAWNSIANMWSLRDAGKPWPEGIELVRVNPASKAMQLH